MANDGDRCMLRIFGAERQKGFACSRLGIAVRRTPFIFRNAERILDKAAGIVYNYFGSLS